MWSGAPPQPQVAHQYKDEDRFYFPHNVDFRGRAYPMHPHLNHLGSDICRAVLTFADCKPLGEEGLYWLHVHVSTAATAEPAPVVP